MHSLYTDMSKTFSAQLKDMQQLPITDDMEVLVGWRCVLTLRKWLSEGSLGVHYGLDICPFT